MLPCLTMKWRGCTQYMKKVLFLTYHFPPCVFGCCIRVFNFVKYLPESNYLPVVLSVLPQYYKDYSCDDDAHLNELSESICVVRTKSLEPLGKLRPGFSASASEPSKEKLSPRSLFSRLIRLLENFVLLPDVQVLWLPYAVAAGYREIKNNPEIELIYAAGPPFSVFVHAMIIKKMTGKPLVIDFKDMWVGRNQHENKSVVCGFFSRYMEKKVVSASKTVILTTKSSLEQFRKRYSNQEQNKFVFLPNGYDPKAEEYTSCEKSSLSDDFHIVHSGVIDTDRDPETLIRVIGKLAAENKEFKKKLRVSFAGKFHSSYLKLVKDLDLEENFKYLGYLDYERNMALLSKATVLLLITTLDAPDAIPGKLYEYFVFSKPILAILEDGAAKDLLVSENLGFISSHGDEKNIENSLLGLFELFQKNEMHTVATVKDPHRYSRRNQTKDLADIFAV